MRSIAPTYPEAPQGLDEKVISPGAAFKTQVAKVILAVLFFLLSYIVLLSASLALGLASAYIGVRLITGYPQFITLMVGGGCIGLGLMVVFFLLKFIFKQNKVDRSGFIEVTVKEQPVLFDFIAKVASETKTQLPKRVYLCHNVNAFVFYDSSFLSLFLPVRKNLCIGLGMVNTLNLSEFKAVIAHEFGHFSQMSMTFGSYVYYVNNILYNMLYDNKGYTEILGRWASMSQYFRLFAHLTMYIVNGMQYLLKQVYIVVNKTYSKLSIEMEYHADAVSAFVNGSSHLITSLKNMNIGDACFSNVLSYYDRGVTLNLKSENFYAEQRELLKQFASDNKIPMKNGDLQITNADNALLFAPSRITITNQWASHPSTANRESRLAALNIQTETITESAWLLFENAEHVQAAMTEKLYEAVTFKSQPKIEGPQAFLDKYIEQRDASSFESEYCGYYDSRRIKRFDTLACSDVADDQTLESLFTDANCRLPVRLIRLKGDIDLLNTISKKESKIKSFDFDGEKYSYEQALEVGQYLQAEADIAEKELNELDKTIYCFFYRNTRSDQGKTELEKSYADMFKNDEESKRDIALCVSALDAMRPVYGEKKFGEIRLIMQDVKLAENKLVPRLKEAVADNACGLSDAQKSDVNAYLNHNRIYFMKPNFDNHAIGIFNKAVNAFSAAVTKRNFEIKKKMLSLQLKTNVIYP